MDLAPGEHFVVFGVAPNCVTPVLTPELRVPEVARRVALGELAAATLLAPVARIELDLAGEGEVVGVTVPDVAGAIALAAAPSPPPRSRWRRRPRGPHGPLQVHPRMRHDADADAATLALTPAGSAWRPVAEPRAALGDGEVVLHIADDGRLLGLTLRPARLLLRADQHRLLQDPPDGWWLRRLQEPSALAELTRILTDRAPELLPVVGRVERSEVEDAELDAIQRPIMAELFAHEGTARADDASELVTRAEMAMLELRGDPALD